MSCPACGGDKGWAIVMRVQTKSAEMDWGSGSVVDHAREVSACKGCGVLRLMPRAREQTQVEHGPRRRSGDPASTGGGE